MAAHGGQVAVQNAAGQGTTFTLTFPYLYAIIRQTVQVCL